MDRVKKGKGYKRRQHVEMRGGSSLQCDDHGNVGQQQV